MSDRIINRTIDKKQIPVISLVVVTILLIGSVIFGIVRINAEEVRLNSNWSQFAADSFAGGSGTNSDPYLISDASQLALLAKQVNAGEDTTGKYYKQTETISLKTHEWMPIGYEKAFKGVYDGNGKKIKNLYLSGKKEVNNYGFFGVNEGKVFDLTLWDSKLNISFYGTKRNWMTGEKLYVGTFAGINRGEIISCNTKSKISMEECEKVVVGMFAGKNDSGILDGNLATGTLTINNSSLVAVGGMAGSLNGKSVTTSCSYKGNIVLTSLRNSDYYAGGFAAIAKKGAVVDTNTAVMDIKDDLLNEVPGSIGGFFGNPDEGISFNHCYCMSKIKISGKERHLSFAGNKELDNPTCGYIYSKKIMKMLGTNEEVDLTDAGERTVFFKEVQGMQESLRKWSCSKENVIPQVIIDCPSYVPSLEGLEKAIYTNKAGKNLLCQKGYIQQNYYGKETIDGTTYVFKKGYGKARPQK